ncbi:hypothetical protein [Mycolicibacter algericus]|uniref:hypothetical protein n=1 Tax=Mycolicibacter algericus TaxID=1288388 RepID=UPI0013D8673E|nr:hypothetical protein [Mycolicibacter algericus]
MATAPTVAQVALVAMAATVATSTKSSTVAWALRVATVDAGVMAMASLVARGARAATEVMGAVDEPVVTVEMVDKQA